MKFAKELEQDLVPEWHAKYFNYKQAKKKVKAVTRAIRNAHKSPGTPFSRVKSNTFNNISRTSTWSAGAQHRRQDSDGSGPSSNEDDEEQPLQNSQIRDAVKRAAELTPSSAVGIPGRGDRQPFGSVNENDQEGGMAAFTKYGSIIGSPPVRPPSRPATLHLPEAAMSSESLSSLHRQSLPSSSPPQERHARRSNHPPTTYNRSTSTSAFEVGTTKQPFKRNVSFTKRHMKSMNHSSKSSKSNDPHTPLLRRMFHQKHGAVTPQSPRTPDVPMEALQDIDKKQDEFFEFLDSELDKIEKFYKSKEDEATNRLQQLREQLHFMRDQRMDEILRMQQRKEERRRRHRSTAFEGAEELNDSKDDVLANPKHIADLPHAFDMLYHPLEAVKQVNFSKKPRNPNPLPTPPTNPEDVKDYTKRPKPSSMPYATAKRKLKAALVEFYRGLELLKSYALLNRTAFRKINKKYDKAVQARPPMRYMNENVSTAHFVQSTVIDGYITAVEDLYARYFEKGSHKIAVGKLRKKNQQAGSYTGSVFRNGIFLALGLVFGIEALVNGANLLFGNNAVVSTNTGYLLQLYAGFFLLLYLFLFFCLDCRLFHENRVNYVFVFEFDTRNNLDWRQLSELPCFFLFLLGFVMWLNFLQIGGETMFVYYPVIFAGIAVFTIFCPLPIFYHDSRKWLLFSLNRLWFGAGLYPVEFRDFFLGDMFCSQTYAMGNIEVFFCLYAHHWNNLPQCNSSHSRLLGFFTTLPGIWRALQCVRRYYDTRAVFPHLVNLGKYIFTILSAISLSTFRIDKTLGFRAFFIACSSINSVYCSFWDLNMDWSLLDPDSPHPYLREHLAYKQTWWYYTAMVVDVLLRFNWVFYVAFPEELQHSAVLSFAVAISEVTRRGIWTIFRVENEHCTNVGRFRASRDVALPYASKKKYTEESEEDSHETEEELAKAREAAAAAGDIPGRFGAGRGGHETAIQASLTQTGGADDGGVAGPTQSSGTDVEQQWWNAADTLRRQQKNGKDADVGKSTAWHKGGQSVRSRIGHILRRAHAQDFERKKTDDVDEAKADLDSDDEDEEPQPSEVDSEEEATREADEEHGQNRGAGPSSSPSGQHGQSTGQDEETRAIERVERETERSNRLDIRDAKTWLQRARSGPDE